MNPQFATTQWTLVWQAAAEDSQHGRPALAEVVKRYWLPLYSFARRRGLSSQDAEDATQEFLSRVMEGNLLGAADPAKGKFRTYLLTAWKRFLIDEYRKQGAARRGGAVQIASLDVACGEQQWLALRDRQSDPEQLFMLSWANTVLDETRQRLQADYRNSKRLPIFEVLHPKLTTQLDATAYAELAQQLSTSVSAVKVAMHRLRQRFGSTLREVIQETLDDPRDVDAELSELLRVMGS
jgi:RNA polymerase sigma-70 factor (ECF subfamily)